MRVKRPQHRQVPIEGYPSEVRRSNQHWELAKVNPQDKSNTNVKPLLYKTSLAQKRLNQAARTQKLDP